MKSTTITEEGRRIRRALIWLAVVVIVLNLVNIAIRALGGGVEVGPPGSTYATTPDGSAAWKELLEATSIETARLEQPLTAGLLDPKSTLVVLEPGFWQPEQVEIDELRRFVHDGGRLVLGGWIPPSVIEDLLGLTTEQSFSGPGESQMWIPSPETEGVAKVVGPGFGSYSDAGAALPIMGGDGLATVLFNPVGDGAVIQLADAGIVSNAYIGAADNAVFAMNLAGGRTVTFDEFVHGYGPPGFWSEVAARWKWALALLGAAVLVWMIAVGRRLGPPEPEGRDLAPERGRFVDSLGALLGRARQPQAATALIRQTARRELARRAGLNADCSPEQLLTAAAALDLSPAEANAIINDPTTDEELMAADRALATVMRGNR